MGNDEIRKLKEKLIAKGDKISKAREVRTLIQKHKKLMGSRQSLTEFDEPTLFLARRSGKLEFYENATAGKFIFTHTNGQPRYLELRPADQLTFPYAEKRVRAYVTHEDRPYSGWDNPIVDSEGVMLGYEKTKATDLKYQERIEDLKRKGKLTWVWILLGIGGAVAIIAFAYNSWIAPSLQRSALIEAQIARETIANNAPPVVGALLPIFKKEKLLQLFNKLKRKILNR